MKNSDAVIPQHAIVFLDHHEARVLFTSAQDSDGERIATHRVEKTKDGHRHPMDRGDLEAIAAKLKGVGEILIAGPSGAKIELEGFLKEHHADISANVVDVVALDHSTLGEVKHFARERFKRADLWA